MGAFFVAAVLTELALFISSSSDALGRVAAMITTLLSGVSAVEMTLVPWLWINDPLCNLRDIFGQRRSHIDVVQ